MIVIDGSWTIRLGKLYVVLFTRKDKELNRIHVGDFRPYFWVKAGNDAETLSADGVPLKRVFTHLPSDVPEERKKYSLTWEADYLFDFVFLKDRGIFYGCDIIDDQLVPIEEPLTLPQFHYFDIEIAAPIDRPLEVTKAEWPVVSIATFDSYSNAKKSFVLCDYENERQLLNDWANYVLTTNPDIMTGWFSGSQVKRLGFDWPYLWFRAKKFRMKMPSRLGIPGPYHCPGRQLIDMMEFFKIWSKPKGEFESYGLKAVAKKMAGYDYDDIGGKIKEYVEAGRWDEIKTYCEHDVEALRQIAEKSNLWDMFEAARKVAGVKLCDTSSRAKLIETLLTRKGAGPLPTRVKKEKKDYKGALVLPAPKGILENVAVLDYSSLYPMIILAYNISPDVQGTYPKIITEFMSMREVLRAKRLAGEATDADETTETGIKFTTTAFYGYMGSPSSRLYAPEKAEFITQEGQAKVKMAGGILGERWIYSDTDSVFFTAADTDEAQVLVDQVNDGIERWSVEQGIKFESAVKLEKFYRRLLFKAKKRYVGWLIWKDGRAVDKIDYVGIETRRSDASALTKQMLESFSDLVLRQGETRRAVEMVRDTMVEVLEGKRLPTEVATPRGLHKTEYAVHNPWQVGMENAVKILGRRLDVFEKPRLLYCIEPVREICIDSNVTNEELAVAGVRVDWKKAAEVTVLKKFQKLCEIIQED